MLFDTIYFGFLVEKLIKDCSLYYLSRSTLAIQNWQENWISAPMLTDARISLLLWKKCSLHVINSFTNVLSHRHDSFRQWISSVKQRLAQCFQQVSSPASSHPREFEDYLNSTTTTGGIELISQAFFTYKCLLISGSWPLPDATTPIAKHAFTWTPSASDTCFECQSRKIILVLKNGSDQLSNSHFFEKELHWLK